MTRTLRTVLAAALSFVVLAPGPGGAQVETDERSSGRGLGGSEPPDVTAEAWLVYDATFDLELGSANSDEQRAMASTTKMMTALVALENASVSDTVEISERAADIGESEIGLHAGEILTLDQLLVAMLIRSANDAAMAISEHVAGSVEAFVKMMNDRASDLGLVRTRFANPHGLDAPDHYSTARDLLAIALEGMQWESFATAVATRTYELPDAPDGSSRVAETTNHLLRDGYQGMLGVKTGYTGDAGLTFVAAAERDGRQIFAVILGSTSHFDDARMLLDWSFREFGLVEVIVAGDTYGRYRVSRGAEPLVAAATSGVLLGKDSNRNVELEPRFTEDLPVVVATLDDQELTRVPLTISTARDLPSLGDAFAWVGRYWALLFDG